MTYNFTINACTRPINSDCKCGYDLCDHMIVDVFSIKRPFETCWWSVDMIHGHIGQTAFNHIHHAIIQLTQEVYNESQIPNEYSMKKREFILVLDDLARLCLKYPKFTFWSNDPDIPSKSIKGDIEYEGCYLHNIPFVPENPLATALSDYRLWFGSKSEAPKISHTRNCAAPKEQNSYKTPTKRPSVLEPNAPVKIRSDSIPNHADMRALILDEVLADIDYDVM